MPFGMSTFSAAQGNISLAQKHLTSSTCVGKKGQKCPRASLRPLAVGCVVTTQADAHHQTRLPWPFAPTAFPLGPVSCLGCGVQRDPWVAIAPSSFPCHEEGEDDKPWNPRTRVMASRAVSRSQLDRCTLTFSVLSSVAVALAATPLVPSGS